MCQVYLGYGCRHGFQVLVAEVARTGVIDGGAVVPVTHRVISAHAGSVLCSTRGCYYLGSGQLQLFAPKPVASLCAP